MSSNDNIMVAHRFMVGGKLQSSVEEHPAAMRGAAIETEHELVQVRRVGAQHSPRPDGCPLAIVMQGTRSDAHLAVVLQDPRPALRCPLVAAFMNIPFPLQPFVTQPSVGDHGLHGSISAITKVWSDSAEASATAGAIRHEPEIPQETPGSEYWREDFPSAQLTPNSG